MVHLLRVIKPKEHFVRKLGKKSTCSITGKILFLSIIKNTEVANK